MWIGNHKEFLKLLARMFFLLVNSSFFGHNFANTIDKGQFK